MPSNRYYAPLDMEGRAYHSSSSRKSRTIPKMEPAEKEFHLTMHDALMEWKAELQEQHEAEMDQLEGKRQRETQKLRRQMKDSIVNKDAAHQAMEEMSRQDQAEIEKLRKQVELLKKGWKKEREEWQDKKKALEKDLDPNCLW